MLRSCHVLCDVIKWVVKYGSVLIILGQYVNIYSMKLNFIIGIYLGNISKLANCFKYLERPYHCIIFVLRYAEVPAIAMLISRYLASTIYVWRGLASVPSCQRMNSCLGDDTAVECTTGLILGLRPGNDTALLCNDVSHWLGANLESVLYSVPFTAETYLHAKGQMVISKLYTLAQKSEQKVLV